MEDTRSAGSLLEQPLSPQLNDTIARLKQLYHSCADLVLHDFALCSGRPALVVYFAGLSDAEQLDRQVLAPLATDSLEESGQPGGALVRRLGISRPLTVQTFKSLAEEIAFGNPVLLLQGEAGGWSLNLAEWDKRAIEEPMAESVVRGPREGFTETLLVNMSLLRRRLRTPDFKMVTFLKGSYTRTRLILAYIETIATPGLVAEATSRLERIRMDGILESGYIEELIEDAPRSPFPQLLSTERPDTVVSQLLEGKIAILTEGTPVVLLAPTTLNALLQSPEDYYQRYLMSSAIRWLRMIFFLVALFAPSLYVAILTYHQEMIPTTLLLSIAKSREEIPFPAVIEAFLMEITFEALREAGVRLPKQVGAAVSIVGALVIGQAATSAGLVSAPMVMVVAITGIASFMMPHYTMGIAIRLLRFPVMLLAGLIGLLGVMLGVIALVIHLCCLRSFGVPYLSPYAPWMRKEWKDAVVRAPVWQMDERPRLTGETNERRQPPGNKPGRNSS